ncbi:unnamed protein product [Plutella xylostella]|uniref:(diamondback moth) hypothetical protein n=1 Tax=Plutella xylostella TaxID=51655 RepID=A0A8S4FU26_PLUXY|nr:unnamed protein product [Plutella xylostella]
MLTSVRARCLSVEKPPTILFRYSNGPIAQTNDGKLLVYPGTMLHMECLWMRRFGNPKWNYTHHYPDSERTYQEGWTTDPGRDSALEYRLSILNAEKADSGVYRCETPARQVHQIEIIVEDVHCPPLPIRRGLVASGKGTQLGTEIRFVCANGNALIGAHTLVCRASGNWSAPLPVCESVECGEVVLDTPLTEGSRRPRVSVISRVVGGRAAFSCPSGWALDGPAETACTPAADWARPFPFPNLWLKAFVLPLPKVPVPSAPNEYRPISVLPFLSKILESVVHHQLTTFLTKGNLLNPFQSGFRPGHSTTTALLKVTEDIRCAMVDRRVTILVLVDFSNAFNAVDHDLLLAVLQCHKISDPAVSWFSSYLRGRQQAIRCGPTVISDWADLSAGVPQGGILSPLLFSTFINFVTSNLKCSYHLYADDLQIYNRVKLDELDAGIAGVNGDLEQILQWSRNFDISVNPSKCQAIIVGGSRLLSGLDYAAVPPVKYDGRVVPFSPTVTDLGLMIDQNLSWEPQLDKVSRKIYASLHSLLRMKNFLPQHTKLALVNSLLLPIIDYADVCYLDLTEALLKVSCPALPPPASGYVLGRAPYRAGDVLQFHCNPEHTLHGRPILVCQDSGRWSDKPPTCAQACTYPGTTISGRMSSVKFYYKIGETVTFTCEPGYRLKGAPMLRCLKNRKWSNAIPLCAPVSNYTNSGDSIAMLNGDIDAMLSDRPFEPADILKLRDTTAILSPESYKAAMTRVAATKLLRRSPIETYKSRVTRVNRLLRRDTER